MANHLCCHLFPFHVINRWRGRHGSRVREAAMLQNPNHSFTQHISHFSMKQAKRGIPHTSQKGHEKPSIIPHHMYKTQKSVHFRVRLGCQCFFIFNLTFNNLFCSLKELEMLELFELTGKWKRISWQISLKRHPLSLKSDEWCSRFGPSNFDLSLKNSFIKMDAGSKFHVISFANYYPFIMTSFSL